MATWRQVSLQSLKLAFLKASRDDGGVKQRTDEPWDLAGLDVPANQANIPRIPIEGDNTHLERAREAFERGEIRYEIAGGKGSRGQSGGTRHLPSTRLRERAHFFASAPQNRT